MKKDNKSTQQYAAASTLRSTRELCPYCMLIGSPIAHESLVKIARGLSSPILSLLIGIF